MVLVENCKVIEGDNFLHPVLIQYEEDGEIKVRHTSAEEILKMFEKLSVKRCVVCGLVGDFHDIEKHSLSSAKME